MYVFRVDKSPDRELAMYNVVAVHEGDLPVDVKHIRVRSLTSEQDYVLAVRIAQNIPRGVLGFTDRQRRWARLTLNEEVRVEPYEPLSEGRNVYLSAINVEVELFSKKKETREKFDTEQMASLFQERFSRQVFTLGQQLMMNFQGFDLVLTVVHLKTIDIDALKRGKRADAIEAVRGQLLDESSILFQKSPESSITLIGKGRVRGGAVSIINPDWDFQRMGVGGLDTEFSSIFRRAFASRVFPPELVEQMGIQHVKGILLYGPPGTGKTLMARQIGKMLNAREPKIVNGPEILSKFVGESEKNIRELFGEAEEEYKAKGDESGLHIVIFDEIDAICKQRGSSRDGTGVHDTVVNQLLAKMDGVDQLNNILVIGMTNRKDLIDEALLRPGRLEVQIEINLPDERGRVQILTIHTEALRTNRRMEADIDLAQLAATTKNYSGAELSGLVRSATSFAMNRLVKASSKVEINEEAYDKLMITRNDFEHALEEVKPAFGAAEETFGQYLLNGICNWGESVERLLGDGQLFVQQVANSTRTPLVSVLFEGPAGAGKTALAARLATTSGFPFIKIISAESMVGLSELTKSSIIAKVFDDAYKSPVNVIVLDDLERIMDFAPIGPRFSNAVMQTIMVHLKKLPPHGRKLLVLGTTSNRHVIKELGLIDSFNAVLCVPNITHIDQVERVLQHLHSCTEQELARFRSLAKSMPEFQSDSHLWVGVKKLIMIAEMAAQDENKIEKLMLALREECLATSH